MSILNEIFAHKRTEVFAAKQCISEAELERRVGASHVPPDFVRALTDSSKPTPRLIAEVKHRSPSKGVLCPNFDPLRLARVYAENGAAAISVLTDEKYFGGELDYLEEICAFLRDPKDSNANPFSLETFENKESNHQASRQKPLGSSVPLLRKDFIFDRYQLLEARTAGASAALLIAAMLDQPNLQSLISESQALFLTPLVEIHTRAELDRALEAGAKVIGINNRDLHTFKVSLQTTLDLHPHIPEGVVVVAESGIKTMDDVARLADAGVDAMLIGEGLLTADKVDEKVREFARLVISNS